MILFLPHTDSTPSALYDGLGAVRVWFTVAAAVVVTPETVIDLFVVGRERSALRLDGREQAPMRVVGRERASLALVGRE